MTADPVDFYRHAPKQRRSSEKAHRILDGAARLLEEMPLEDVSVKLIADRAGIPNPTFYGYFRDRDAVFSMLGLRYLDEAMEIVDALMSATYATWEESIDRAIDGYVVWIRERAGFRALWFGGQLDDILAAADRRGKDDIAMRRRMTTERIAGSRADGIPYEAYRFFVEMVDRMITFGFEIDPDGDPRVFAEAKFAARAYLGAYLNRGR